MPPINPASATRRIPTVAPGDNGDRMELDDAAANPSFKLDLKCTSGCVVPVNPGAWTQPIIIPVSKAQKEWKSTAYKVSSGGVGGGGVWAGGQVVALGAQSGRHPHRLPLCPCAHDCRPSLRLRGSRCRQRPLRLAKTTPTLARTWCSSE